MKNLKSSIPEQLVSKMGRKERIVDIRLRDGRVLSNVLVTPNGEIEGTVVGGHDGVEELEFSFAPSDVYAIRRRDGFLAAFGFSRWESMEPEPGETL